MLMFSGNNMDFISRFAIAKLSFAKLPHFAGSLKLIISALFLHFYDSFQWIFQGVNYHTFTTWKRCEMATVSSVIFAGAHKYSQSFRMSIQYPRNICDV